ncbi:MAG: NAD(P)/FAD-dependent oxidoreductase [Acidobacteria bacterium]|nr:NAD(P)/FAD-dependent oxidoreductase [Acidobacteriota bacterium]
MNSGEADVDVIILGAGAAGLMCALQAGRRGRRVLVIDHWPAIGERIRISGGGHCNFTNRSVSAANYLSQNPHFCRSALARFPPSQFVAMVDEHGIAYEERDHGQLFCSRSAEQITQMLLGSCDEAGVRIAARCHVAGVTAADAGDASVGARFSVATSHGTFRSQSLVVATGGLAAPKLGATPVGYRLAEQFGLRIVPPKPALVPLALPSELLVQLAPLSGVAFEAEAASAASPEPRFRNAVLITHQGLSGPAILQLSSYWQMREYGGGPKGAVTLNLFPDVDSASWLEEKRTGTLLLSAALSERLPRRFARAWCALRGFDRPVNQMSRAELDATARALSEWTLAPSGTLGFEKAEVTLGGVDTGELSSKTMEAGKVPGLYFIGEVVDVTGWLGGYNFQWAWSSGWAAGQYV